MIGAIPYSAQNKGRDVVPMEVADGEGKCALRDEIFEGTMPQADWETVAHLTWTRS